MQQQRKTLKMYICMFCFLLHGLGGFCIIVFLTCDIKARGRTEVGRDKGTDVTGGTLVDGFISLVAAAGVAGVEIDVDVCILGAFVVLTSPATGGKSPKQKIIKLYIRYA
jgi:hypothetical protein